MAVTSVAAAAVAVQPPTEGHLPKKNKGFNPDRNLTGGPVCAPGQADACACRTESAFYYHEYYQQVADYMAIDTRGG